MQVDEKPSLWPCVVMLLGLFLLCLVVPRLWKPPAREHEVAQPLAGSHGPHIGNERRPSAIDQLAAKALGSIANMAIHNGESYGGMFLTSPSASSFLGGIPSSASLPLTLESPAASTPHSTWPANGGPNSFDMLATAWPGFKNAASPENLVWPKAGGNVSIVAEGPSPFVLTAIEGIGQVLADYATADIVSWLAARVAAFDPMPLFERSVASDDLSDEQPASESLPVAVAAEVVIVSPPEQVVPSDVSTPLAADVLAAMPVGPPAPVASESTEPAAGSTSPVIHHPATSEPQSPPQSDETSEETADSVTAPQTSTGPWSVPTALFEQLDIVAQHPFSASWALATISQLRTIASTDSAAHSDVEELLERLAQSAEFALQLAAQTSDDRLRVELLRSHWALKRRIDCWKVICEIHTVAEASPRIAARGSLHSLFAGVSQTPLERADLPALSQNLESYERSRDPRLARQVAQQRQALGVSANELDQSLADAVEQNYRNANVRVALTAEFINRLVARRREENRYVRDRIAGTPVQGQSHTISRSRVSLQPAQGYWHLNVETQGVVESDTLANGGPARLRTFGATDFVARKSVVFDTHGVRLSSASVAATNFSHLANVRTEYDWVPLLGPLARDRAVREYRAKRPQAKFDVETKVSAQTAEQVDREIADAVGRTVRTVRERVSDPITRSGVEITPIELTTTPERLVARLRVAGEHQLGSHTPRPRALTDSLASLQLHETALTNAATSLALDGQRLTGGELRDRLRSRFSRMEAQSQADAHHDTVFEFAGREAVKFRIDDGKVELVLSLARFEHQGRASRNVIVHAHYVPAVTGLRAELVRDGPLGIEGRLGSGERARLHNAFNAVLSTERRLPLLPIDAEREQQFADLIVTQLVLEDGWLGMAIGPNAAQRVAERTRSLR